MRHLFRFLLASAAAGCAADAEPTRPDPPLTQSGAEVRYRLTILEPEAGGLNQSAGINNSGLVTTADFSLLRSVLPGFDLRDVHAEPCCTTHTPSGFPYVDFADDPRIVWLLGCNAYAGKSADELGRLAARLVIDGRWTDSLDAGLFRARYE